MDAPALTASGAAAVSTGPAFSLPVGAVCNLNGVRVVVERRLSDRTLQFLSVEERTPLFYSDQQLAEMMKEGGFYLENDGGRAETVPPPISPLLVGADAYARNQRKHHYVTSCLSSPDFARSRKRLTPIIAEVASALGENPPAFSTILEWIDEHGRHGGHWGTAAYSDRDDLKGTRGSRLAPFQERAIEVGLHHWVKLRVKKSAYAVVVDEVHRYDAEHGDELDKATLGKKFVDAQGRLRPPSPRTFDRRCDGLDRMLQDWGLKGAAVAKQKNRTRQTRALPDRPYAEVEVDHTRLDVLVIDEGHNAVLGRPDIIVFRDRATAMVIGLSVGFEEPSYAAFAEGLRHAIYPKDLSAFPAVTNPWPCHGRIENLFVDNALHFLGDNIEAAGRELGFHVVRCQPRQPWLKGGIERFFGSLNIGLLHQLPGTSLGNVLDRADHEHLGRATLTLTELETLIHIWICDLYHAEPRKALGFIRGFGDVPLRVWEDKCRTFRTAPLPHIDLFMSLAGDRAFRPIQNDGICWDYIKYESPELWALRSHPDHRRPAEGGSTKYEVRRDPYDLGSISVINPFDRTILKVPAVEAHRGYASGLSLHQHQVIVKNAHDRRRERVDFDALVATRAALARVAAALSRHPGRKMIERRLSRYLHVERARHWASAIEVDEPLASPAGFDDLLPPPKTEIGREAWTEMAVETPARPSTVSALDDDLDEIRRRKNWDEFDG